MSTIVTREGKGSALTYAEGDDNLTNLNTDKIQADSTDTLTNKTIDLASNILTGTIAEFDAALSDGSFSTDAGVETLTNKTILAAGNTLDANVEDIAGLANTNGNFIVGDGANFVAESGATARTSLGLDSMSTQAASAVAITGGDVTGITDLAVADGGTGASDASTARTNLGLGTASVEDTGTGSGNVPLVGTSSTTDALAGLIELATQAEVDAGTDTSRAVTPNTLSSSPQATQVWVNFNGTGTIAINGSYNVASLTDNSAGDVTVHISNALPNSNYTVAGSAISGGGALVALHSASLGGPPTTKTTTQFRMEINNTSGTPVDSGDVSIIVNAN